MMPTIVALLAVQVGVEGVFDAVAVRVVLEARKWQGESEESYTQRSEDLCYQASSCFCFFCGVFVWWTRPSDTRSFGASAARVVDPRSLRAFYSSLL